MPEASVAEPPAQPTARRRSLGRTLELTLRRYLTRKLDSEKRRLVDRAFEEVGARSFADLGGVWRVKAGYTFYALDKHRPERGVLVDGSIDPDVRARAEKYPALELIEDRFGDPAVARQAGQVDTTFLFDVLLHQAKPDWRDILTTYAPVTRSFAIFNPQWVAGPDTVRLLDLSRDSFLKHTPPTEYAPYGYDHQDEVYPGEGVPWRDAVALWQWGITDRDLESALNELGFELRHSDAHGQWGGLEHFEDHSFVFVKR